MATLFYSPTFLSLSSHKFLVLPHRQNNRCRHQLKYNYEDDLRRNRFNFTVCACSEVKLPRSRRKAKSNEQLCKDIREFLATAGLPEGHIPSIKELSDHGRNDLASIVRRRGYKLIKALLESPSTADINEVTTEKGLTGQDQKLEDVPSSLQDAHVGNCSNRNSFEDFVETSATSATSSLEESELSNLCSQIGNGNNDEVIPLSTDAVVEKNHYCTSCTDVGFSSKDNPLLSIESSSSLALEGNASYDVSDNSCSDFLESVDFNEHGYMPSEATTLEEKVANFIQNGDLDKIEDYGILNENDGKESKEVIQGGNGVEIPSAVNHVSNQQYDYDIRSDSVITINGSSMGSKHTAPSATVDPPLRDDHLTAEELVGAGSEKDSDIEISRRGHQDEINRLKFMLHQKELELSRLKHEIEKEKLALSDLQEKAEREINKAKQLISEKDSELQAAEESLSGLEEVRIQYSGDGEIVEVTGSFNGWHHWIKMDPEPSANILEPIGSGKSRLWSTVLWLYPGTYEIKFIVDGQWMVDPQRESVTMGGICNNILRVER